ncbi:MAG: M1 family aminopeptidase [bacterium]|nr:M1 family aminopeptidase [bacterium]
MFIRFLLVFVALSVSAFAQVPPIEPGVSQELAEWRAVRYSEVQYKLNLTLEKMSPVLKGTVEIKLQYAAEACAECPPRFIVLDWRKIRGHEEKSTISNVTLNGAAASVSPSLTVGHAQPDAQARASARAISGLKYEERDEHLIFADGVVMGENVIKLDFTSPILPSGSAITRYVDKEDGSEYLYSLFVPSDASTAFPVFDQPDIKAKFSLIIRAPFEWHVIGNSAQTYEQRLIDSAKPPDDLKLSKLRVFAETKPISTYVFAFAAGPFEKVSEPGAVATGFLPATDARNPVATAPGSDIYVRKSQAAKFKPHAAEVARLNREAIKYFEEYFDYKFPFPKYDLVLIPEFPFGGMEHAGATFLREASIIFPQEPTKNDHISRATLIFHEAAHQWFGDTVTMRWFDDLWLKEGFATFTAYKAMEKIMPEMNEWKVFYERVKQAAYQTDSTKGTTPIYQEIKNLSAAKSAYGNIVYNKAPAFLRQAEFYLGEDKFKAAVRAFLKKHEFRNAGWEDLVKEFETASGKDLKDWANVWVKERGLPVFRVGESNFGFDPSELRKKETVTFGVAQQNSNNVEANKPVENVLFWREKAKLLLVTSDSKTEVRELNIIPSTWSFGDQKISGTFDARRGVKLIFPNYQDYGYGIFLLDDRSRDYVLKNIQNEKDPFLRSMMWGALWDSVREGELDPREYVELVVRVQSSNFSLFPAGKERSAGNGGQAKACTLNCDDESTTALLLNRVGTAMNYYLSEPGAVATGFRSGTGTKNPVATAPGSDLVEEMLITGMRNSPTLGQRITYYRALLNIASSEKARNVLKAMLKGGNLSGSEGVSSPPNRNTLPTGRVSASIPIKTKDKFDIVTRLLILNDPEAPKLLADLEKAETGDDAKRYAYAAKAGIGTAENKAKYWNDFVNNKEISESWIEAAFGPWNSIRHSDLTLPYLQKALQELPNHKRNRKIFFVNGWLGAFIGGQRSEEALAIVNKFLADNPNVDNDLRLKILENVDVIERAVKIRQKPKR